MGYKNICLLQIDWGKLVTAFFLKLLFSHQSTQKKFCTVELLTQKFANLTTPPYKVRSMGLNVYLIPSPLAV